MSLDYYDDLQEFIDNISGGNVRLALDLVKGFFGSGHVDTEKIVRAYNEQGKYYIPLHEFLRAVIFGDGIYYDPQRSVIANLFDIYIFESKEQFLMPMLLALLVILGKSSVEQGFVETKSLYDKLQGFGFIPDQIDMVVVKAYRKKLLEPSARIIPQPGKEMPQTIRITTIGSYHIKRLYKIFTYIDAIIVDTPILDKHFRDKIFNVSDIEDRLKRAIIFCDYLDIAWESIKDAETIFNWPSISREVRSHVEEIGGKVEMKQEPRSQ